MSGNDYDIISSVTISVVTTVARNVGTTAIGVGRANVRIAAISDIAKFTEFEVDACCNKFVSTTEFISNITQNL